MERRPQGRWNKLSAVLESRIFPGLRKLARAGFIVSIVLTLAATAVVLPCARAQSDSAGPAAEYPHRLVRIVLPFPPGGGTDIVARTLAQKLSDAWGQPVVVENRAGANGIIGTDLVAKSKPDGYTILFTIVSHTINPMLYPKLPYDSSRDFAPVTMLAEYPFTLVIHPSLPVKNVKELIALAKARPRQLSYATSGIGSGPHLGVELFSSMAGINMVHVPYKGAGPGVIDLIAGQVQLSFNSLLASVPMIKAGKLRLLAVTSATRSPMVPDVPSIAETLPGFHVTGWHSLLMPAATPRAIIAKLHAETVKALRLSDVKGKLASEGLTLIGSTPEQFAEFLAAETSKWAKVIKAADVRLD